MALGETDAVERSHVAAKVWIGVKSRAEFLRRLSVVFAIELRLKIVTELYMREMSPKQFHEEFGGGTLSRVDKNFKRLAEHGWLRHVRSETGGKRRGAREHFYRATELAYFDDDTWTLLPYSLRVAFSWSAFKQIAKRLREAMEARAFEARLSSHLACERLLLDRLGWKRVMEAIDTEFVSLFEEQEDARLRVCHSGEELVRASVVLFGFESATVGGCQGGPHLVECDTDPLISIPVRLSKVFADEICLQIVEQANLHEISAKRFCTEFDGDSLSDISRRFKMLERLGWLNKVGEKTGGPRRGAVEHFYRAAGPAIQDKGLWENAPESLKGTEDWRTFEDLSDQVIDAMKAGTFDSRADRYLAWSLVSLDRQGLVKVIASSEGLLAFCQREHELSKDRVKRSGERPLPMTAALAVFEWPVEAKAP